MVLTEWDSVDIAALRDVLAPRISIGPFAGYTHQLTREPVHAIDRPFSCPRLFEPEIDPASYSTPPLMGAPGSILAKQLRRAMGPDQHLLTVHTDTKARKMWSARKFLETIEGFLDCRPDFIAVIVGQRHGMCLPESKHANRIFDFCRIPLGLTFSVVQNSSLFLGIDSCMLHVSDLARVPGVGLFGPTSPKVWGFRFARHVHLMGVDGDLDSSSVVNALLSMSPPS